MGGPIQQVWGGRVAASLQAQRTDCGGVIGVPSSGLNCLPIQLWQNWKKERENAPCKPGHWNLLGPAVVSLVHSCSAQGLFIDLGLGSEPGLIWFQSSFQTPGLRGVLTLASKVSSQRLGTESLKDK